MVIDPVCEPCPLNSYCEGGGRIACTLGGVTLGLGNTSPMACLPNATLGMDNLEISISYKTTDGISKWNVLGNSLSWIPYGGVHACVATPDSKPYAGTVQCRASMNTDSVGIYIAWIMSAYASGLVQSSLRSFAGLPTLEILGLRVSPALKDEAFQLRIGPTLSAPDLNAQHIGWGSTQAQIATSLAYASTAVSLSFVVCVISTALCVGRLHARSRTIRAMADLERMMRHEGSRRGT